MITLEQMVNIAARKGSVRWKDGATTPVWMEDTHLFGMVIVRQMPDGGVDVVPLENEYDAAEVTP